MALDVKICGLRTAPAIAAAATRGASHVGFISFEKSPRHLTIDAMAALRDAVPAKVELVIVTVDPADDFLVALMDRVRPDMIQLHGGESPERVLAVKAVTGARVMKAIAIGSAEDVLRLSAYRGVADRLLLDAKRPRGSALPGGNGVSFDWSLLARLDPGIDYMLSGGLDAGNVGAALAEIRPKGLDVSSGVETSPGVKDIALIHGFFDALEQAAKGAAGDPVVSRDRGLRSA